MSNDASTKSELELIGVYLGVECEEIRLPLKDRPNCILLKVETKTKGET